LESSAKQRQTSTDAFPYRPAFATQGSPVTVWANYFKVNVNAPVLWKYTVNIQERSRGKDAGSSTLKDVKGRKLPLVMEKVYNRFAEAPTTKALATDYKTTLISLTKLVVDSQPLIIELPRDSATESDVFEVNINGPFELHMEDLASYLQTQDHSHEDHIFPRFPEEIDALNTIVGTRPRGLFDDISVVGSGRFFPFGPSTPNDFQHFFNDGRPILASRGFFQSTRIATGRLLLNTNVTCGVFRMPGKFDDICKQFGWTLSPGSGASAKIRKGASVLNRARVEVTFQDSKGNKIKRKKVIHSLVTPRSIRTRGEHAPTFDCQGNDYANVRQISFWLEEAPGKGRYVTVDDYFKNKYKMELGPWPVANVGTAEKPVFFPAEVVEILPGQAVKTKLTGRETTGMLDHACKKPKYNAKTLETASRAILHLDDDLLGKFSISVDKKLLAVHARVLNAPLIQYSSQGQQKTIPPKDGSWNMTSVKVFRGARIDNWACYSVYAQFRDMSFPTTFAEEARKIGIHLGDCASPLLPLQLGGHNWEEILRKVFQDAEKRRLQFMLFIFPQEDKDGIYNKIKSLGDCEFGIRTSCIIAKKFEGKQPHQQSQYFANVLLKWNLKAGGVNHKLSQDVALIKDDKTMVVGYDVTHPTNMPMSGGDLPPSLVGVVASVDKDLGQWPSFVWEQPAKQEMLSDRLVEAFKSRLVLWRGRAPNAKPLPENIIIFRDGVSESQFSMVVDRELPHIREACQLMYGKGKQPKLSLIVSVKRHQTRFYPAQDGKVTNSGNIRCGTVVDRDVTQARFWDFYLTAHNALKGTARPAHYTVLLDEIFRAKFPGRAAEELEKLTHEMCYLFGRATKAISICPPAYYADIVCERARLHRPEYDVSETQSVSTVSQGNARVQTSIHPKLKDTMYYI